MKGPVTVAPARSASDLQATSTLFLAYAEALGLDLSFQSFATEVSTLPGKYAPPSGEILLARDTDGVTVGCVALRSLDTFEACCEVKRLYISPAARGMGLGRMLADALCDVARERGYREIRLDTLPDMRGAIRLYKSMGFVEIERYYDTPLEGTIFLAKQLGSSII
ncbi:MAG: hypothetical protein M1827_005596 [Pycnora praestabilis]|nr:MAG: hypothetical protein M1827_005596 [Pycnora praestabilis]